MLGVEGGREGLDWGVVGFQMLMLAVPGYAISIKSKRLS